MPSHSLNNTKTKKANIKPSPQENRTTSCQTKWTPQATAPFKQIKILWHEPTNPIRSATWPPRTSEVAWTTAATKQAGHFNQQRDKTAAKWDKKVFHQTNQEEIGKDLIIIADQALVVICSTRCSRYSNCIIWARISIKYIHRINRHHSPIRKSYSRILPK